MLHPSSLPISFNSLHWESCNSREGGLLQKNGTQNSVSGKHVIPSESVRLQKVEDMWLQLRGHCGWVFPIGLWPSFLPTIDGIVLVPLFDVSDVLAVLWLSLVLVSPLLDLGVVVPLVWKWKVFQRRRRGPEEGGPSVGREDPSFSPGGISPEGIFPEGISPRAMSTDAAALKTYVRKGSRTRFKSRALKKADFGDRKFLGGSAYVEWKCWDEVLGHHYVKSSLLGIFGLVFDDFGFRLCGGRWEADFGDPKFLGGSHYKKNANYIRIIIYGFSSVFDLASPTMPNPSFSLTHCNHDSLCLIVLSTHRSPLSSLVLTRQGFFRRTIVPHWTRSVALELSFSRSRIEVVAVLEPLSNPNLKSPLSKAMKASSTERTEGLRSIFSKCGNTSLPEQSPSAKTVVRPPWFAETFIWLEIPICETLGWFVPSGRDNLEL
ncbi:hypothetical protein V8G54_018710 [Vigna mungo]|uniref:Uncharacterized protein n=1 Tax=Vigna mungo TaxID=3915 RepID=A0AAQ3RRQ6_VIGMU